MIGRITVKRALKHAAGRAAAATVPFVRRPRASRVCILMYHRVADIDFVDPDVDDWNVRPDTFARQIAALSECAEFVRLADVPERRLMLAVAVTDYLNAQTAATTAEVDRIARRAQRDRLAAGKVQPLTKKDSGSLLFTGAFMVVGGIVGFVTPPGIFWTGFVCVAVGVTKSVVARFVVKHW